MIKNERQYRITKAQAVKFASALQEMTTAKQRACHPLLQQAQVDALHSQLEELQQDIADYEALQSGTRTVVALDSWEALPRTLIQARIAAGLTQEELAAKLGLKPQQIQRYEATEYQTASFERIMEILRVLGVKLRHPVELHLAAELTNVE